MHKRGLSGQEAGLRGLTVREVSQAPEGHLKSACPNGLFSLIQGRGEKRLGFHAEEAGSLDQGPGVGGTRAPTWEAGDLGFLSHLVRN